MIIVWKNYSCDTIDTAVLLEWLTVTLVALQYWSYWILEINKHKELLTGLKINFLGIVNSEWLVVMWEGFHSIVASYPAPMSLHCESALDPWIHPPPTSNDIIHGHRYLRATARVGQYLYFFFYLPEAGSKQGFVSLFWFVFVFVFVFCGGKDMAGKIGIYWKFIFIYIKTSTIALHVQLWKFYMSAWYEDLPSTWPPTLVEFEGFCQWCESSAALLYSYPQNFSNCINGSLCNPLKFLVK